MYESGNGANANWPVNVAARIRWLKRENKLIWDKQIYAVVLICNVLILSKWNMFLYQICNKIITFLSIQHVQPDIFRNSRNDSPNENNEKKKNRKIISSKYF